MPGEPAGGDKSRYETIFRLASGGMANVFLGTVRGAFGFRQLVAIKKPHVHLVVDPSFRQSLLREARLASLIHHANVVDVRDVEVSDDEVSLVMDYVEGASLHELLQAQAAAALEGESRPLPAGVAVRIVLDACAGLHAAHEQTDERGRPLRIVHRDISPQNLLVGVDGLTRVADFGVAKFKRKADSSTMTGVLKGKLAYMAPEYVKGEGIDRRFDVFALGVVLWEALTGERLFRGDHVADTLDRVLSHEVPSVSTFIPALGTAFDAIVDTALAKDPAHRFENAAAMAQALETSARGAGLLGTHREVAELVKAAVGPRLEDRRALIRARLANEPSVASMQFDPDAEPATLLDPPAATTLPEAKAASTIKLQPVEVTKPVEVRPRPPAPEHQWQDPTLVTAPCPGVPATPVPPRVEATPAPPRVDSSDVSQSKTGPRRSSRVDRPSEAIVLPIESAGPWRYVAMFLVITVAVAAGVVALARLRASDASSPSAAPSAVHPPAPIQGRSAP